MGKVTSSNIFSPTLLLCALFVLAFVSAAISDDQPVRESSTNSPGTALLCENYFRLLLTSPEKVDQLAQEIWDQLRNNQVTRVAVESIDRRFEAIDRIEKETIAILEKAHQLALHNALKQLGLFPAQELPLLDERLAVTASRIYGEALPVFRQPASMEALGDIEVRFLRSEYNRKIKKTLKRIKAYASSVIADDPDTSPTLGVIMILPLLHVVQDRLSIAPDELIYEWCSPHHINHLVDFCIRVDQRLLVALQLGEYQAEFQNLEFDPVAFFSDLSKRQQGHRRWDLALMALRKGVSYCEEKRLPSGSIASLGLEVVSVYQETGNLPNAENYSLELIEDFSAEDENSEAVRKILTVWSKLMRDRGAYQQMLKQVETLLADTGDGPYKPLFLYEKWQALRSLQRIAEAANVLGWLEAKYPQHDILEELYLSLVLDCIAAQRYADANTILEMLMERFPTSLRLEEFEGLHNHIKQAS